MRISDWSSDVCSYDLFTIPEQRQLRYILIDRARFEKNAAPSDADIQLYYTENKANYAAREERTLEQVIIHTQASAQTIADKVKVGTRLAASANHDGPALATLSDTSHQQCHAAVTNAFMQQ